MFSVKRAHTKPSSALQRNQLITLKEEVGQSRQSGLVQSVKFKFQVPAW